jgi:tetratricopeptide (TPR) repeat protein
MKPKLLLAVVALAIFAFSAADKPDRTAEAARLNNLGAAYMNQQLFQKAAGYFQQASELDPKLSMAHLNLGIAQLNLGKVGPARDLLQEAVKQRPDDAHAWYNLGLLDKNSDNSQAAIDDFRHVVALAPDDPDSWYFLGASYAQARQFSEAIDAFEHALKLNPLHASAQFGIARSLQQSGKMPEAREHLHRFQEITQKKLGVPISLAYGDQGKYSLVEESAIAPEKVPEQTKVRFVDVTREAGFISKPAAPAESGNSSEIIGSGACWLDYDADGRPDLFLLHGPQAQAALYHNLGTGKFEDVTRKAGLADMKNAIGCTAGDYDNDGATDLAVTTGQNVLLFHNEKSGTFKEVTPSAGIAASLDPSKGWFNAGATFVDYDHDGDLDLYVSRGRQRASPGSNSAGITGANVMYRNNGNGTFTDVTENRGLSGVAPGYASVGSDYNNDRAVDLVVTGSETSIFENPREGKFTVKHPWQAQGPQFTTGVAVLDFNHDSWMDLAFTSQSPPGLTLWRNNEARSFDQVKLPPTNWVRGFGVTAFDYDNDGWVDLVAAGETADGKGEVRLFRNLGPDGWKDVSSDVGLDKIAFKDPRAIVTADFDGDGATDFLVTQNHGPAILLRNEGATQNHWLKLSLKGLNDNKSAIGTKVEVFAGGNRQKFEIAGSNGYLGQNSTDIVVGLGRAKQADIVRMLWPTGVLQDEIEVAADKEDKIIEIDRRGSSCPTLFVWNGQHYELVDDLLGAGVVGHWVGPHERNIPRPTEYIKIDRAVIREKNTVVDPHPSDSHVSQNRRDMGHPTLSFRFMEPLEEAVYLDRVRLLAVDHPAGVEVYPNEYFAGNPPYPPFKVVFSDPQDTRPPAGAWDNHGHNVLPDLRAHRYFGDFKILPFLGFAEMHSLELDLGKPYEGGPLWLLAHGEIEYFSATSMYAADQAKLKPVSPYVEALKDGKWVRVVDDMGFPAGGARTITADLTHRLPAGTRRIRIWTNLQIYWDSILISRTAQVQSTRVTAVPLERANLRFHGFPRKIEDQPPGNVKYRYEETSATGPYTHPAGSYTRYGDVLPLLSAFDDQLAVFASGDEVALDFDPAKLPALPQGWIRDYFFAVDGYEKDMDFYAYHPTEVDPLPFRAMGTYPYPGKSFPADAKHVDYLLQYNTRHLSGNEPRGYAFEYSDKR